jgi:hypothetical protein
MNTVTFTRCDAILLLQERQCPTDHVDYTELTDTELGAHLMKAGIVDESAFGGITEHVAN